MTKPTKRSVPVVPARGLPPEILVTRIQTLWDVIGVRLDSLDSDTLAMIDRTLVRLANKVGHRLAYGPKKGA